MEQVLEECVYTHTIIMTMDSVSRSKGGGWVIEEKYRVVGIPGMCLIGTCKSVVAILSVGIRMWHSCDR